MPRAKRVDAAWLSEIRKQARADLAADARARGDVAAVEALERRRLPEAERWAIAENAKRGRG